VLALGFQDADALPAETLDLAIVAAGDQQGVPHVTCSGGRSAANAPAPPRWEYNDAGVWRELTLLQDDTLAFTRSGHVLLKLPAAEIPPAGEASVPPGDPVARYWIRALVVKSQYEKPPRIRAIR